MTVISPPVFERDVLGRDRASLRKSVANRFVYSVGKDRATATTRDWFHATALAVRDRLIERQMDTTRTYERRDAKRVYCLSMEFLTGRLLSNSLLNIGLADEFRSALTDFEVELDDLRRIEQDAALGNGGLGRLAACLLDSMATLSIPGIGYGIRYEYGLFFQVIENANQVEHPDTWLRYGNPWELTRPELLFPVRFGGRTIEFTDERGRLRCHWVDAESVLAMAYDTPVPGYNGATVNNMRLWSARATRDFNLQHFNEGNYFKAVEQKTVSENLSKVLYPDDSTQVGRELRLKQQYFVNHDPAVGDLLKVVFIPNYNVSNAEEIIPACELSEQISTAGTEASGTGNMKLALNGALTIGTLDGANIEIRREVGDNNIFIFGMSTTEVAACRWAGYRPWDWYAGNNELRQSLDMIADGYFSPEDPSRFRPVFDRLTAEGDYFLLLADYASYVACQEQVDTLHSRPGEWARCAILNVAGMGAFSSDRTISEYARLIWNVKPITYSTQ